MVTQPFSTKPAYAQLVTALLRLHSLTEAGQDESPEADAIRDSMERTWFDLSEAEKKRLTGLSQDLFSISEATGQALPSNSQSQRKLLEAIEARDSGDWDMALELLRRWGRYLDPAILSWLRATVWEKAGDCDTAIPFYQHAVRLNPEDDKFAYMYLAALRKSDPDAARASALEIVAKDESYPALVVAQAADILATLTRGMPFVDARPLLEQLTNVLTRALEKLQLQMTGHFSAVESLQVNIIFLLGFCYERLGDVQTALHYHNLGLSIAPRNEALLVARGRLRYGVDVFAADDFEQAIKLGSTNVWPYFFLAHQHLVNNRFDTCRRMCERALQFPASDEVRARTSMNGSRFHKRNWDSLPSLFVPHSRRLFDWRPMSIVSGATSTSTRAPRHCNYRNILNGLNPPIRRYRLSVMPDSRRLPLNGPRAFRRARML